MTLPVSELHSGRLMEHWSEPESEPELLLAEYFLNAVRPDASESPIEEGGVKSGRALNSFLIGVRAPDIGGLAVKDLTDLRELHLERTGQEAHFLRAVDDDWEDGNLASAEAGRRFILEKLDQSKRAFDASPKVIEVDAWIEHYGRVSVPVIESAYLLGQALHALQDSFTHTYRAGELDQIYVVQTYIESFSGDFDERRDGPRHSDYFDDCDHPDVAPIERAATEASLEFVRAAQRYWRSGNRAQAEQVLDRWLRVRPGCANPESSCDSAWLEIGRRKETTELVSCGAAPGPAPCVWLLLGFAAMCTVRGTRRS